MVLLGLLLLNIQNNPMNCMNDIELMILEGFGDLWKAVLDDPQSLKMAF